MPSSASRFILPALALLSPLCAEPVFTDTFSNGDPAKADARGRFWTVEKPAANPDSGAVETNGRLVLTAANWAHTYVSLVSPVREDFGFFARPITVTLDDLALTADGIPANDARCKLSFVSTAERAEKAPDAISLRLRPGLLLFGFRIDGFEPGNSPENLSGQRTGSLVAEPLSGTPSKLTLTLGPSATPGHIRFEIRAEGNGVSFSRTGSFPLTKEQWGLLDASALVIDVRRDHPAALSGTSAELSVGQLTVTR